MDVRPIGREVFEITPREIVTTTFRVTNSTSESHLFIGKVELPEGWRLITEDFPFELGPNESITKLVSFFVPEKTSAGRYKIKYLIRAREYPSIRDFYTVDVIVSPGSKEKELQESPPYAVAGEDYRVCFLVTNKTEIENTININVESSENIPFSVDSPRFKLGPGQSRTITVTVKPDANITKKLEHHLRVTAQASQDGKPGTKASAVHSIRIVPRGESTIEESGDAVSAEDAIRQSGDKVEDKATLTRLKRKDVEDNNSVSLERRSKANLRLILGPRDAKELLETEPRRIVTTVFRVTNPTDKKREFIPEVTLPEGWVLITKGFPFELNPNETDAKLLTFFVPQAALAGKYELTYVIKDRKHPDIRDFYTTYVIVLPVSKLQVKLLESPMFVIAGEEYKSSFVVTNQGNAECAVSTMVESSENFAYTVDTEKFTLGPDQSKTVVVSVKTDSRTTKELKQLLQFTAKVAQEGKTKVQSKATSFIEIIPKISGVEDRFHKIPTEVTLRYVSQNNTESTSGLQTEVKGKGTLDEEGKKHIKFRFIGPDIQDKSIFGERDEYTLSYWTKDHEIHLGDRNYSLSWLTENYFYGRGIEGKLHINDEFSLGAYHMKTRWLEPRTEETAAYIDFLLSDKNKVGLNYLRKLRDGKISNITSFEGELEPFKNTKVDLEYAIGPGGTKRDNAYLTKLYGRNDWFNYYLKLTHAGPDYPGYYNDLDYISAGLMLPVNKHLRLNASCRREKNNLDEDPAFYSAPLEKYYQLGLDYRWKKDTTFSLDWLTRDRRDRLDSPRFDYEEDTLRFSAGRSFDKLTIHTSAEFGKTKNKLDSTTSDSERYSASAYFKPDEKQSYGAYFYYDKNSDFTGENNRSTTVGLNAAYKITNRTFVNFALQTNNHQGSTRRERDNLELGVSHIFANNNKLSLLARHTRYKNSNSEDDTAFMVQYTIPLGLPVARKKSVGSVNGYIYDEETGNAIDDVILRLNDLTAISDKAGNFTFPSVSLGIWYLNIDTASIGMDRVPTRKTPIEVAVRGGEKTLVTVSVTRAASVLGQIIVYDYENSHNKTPLHKKSNNTDGPYYISGNSRHSEDAKLIEGYGLANTIVELRNNSEIKRDLTDSRGHFEFQQLRPGKWTLKIYSDNLPEYHYLEKDTLEVELKPGQRIEIDAKVLPKKRRIRIIAEPQTLLKEVQK